MDVKVQPIAPHYCGLYDVLYKCEMLRKVEDSNFSPPQDMTRHGELHGNPYILKKISHNEAKTLIKVGCTNVYSI